jgi:hypothetical protein
LHSPARAGYGAARLASLGLAGVHVLLSIFAVWGALSTYRAGSAVKHIAALSDPFEAARFAVATEESLERKYRLEPSAKVRGQHHAASDDLRKELERAHRLGNAADKALVDDVLALHEDYLTAIDQMFAPVDAGDTMLSSKSASVSRRRRRDVPVVAAGLQLISRYSVNMSFAPRK